MLSCCYCHHQHQTSSTYELFPSRAEPPKYALAHTIPQAIYIMLIACFIVSSPRDRQLGTSMWLPSWCHLQFQGRKPDVGWLPVSRFGAAAFDLKINVPLSDFVIHTVFYRLLHLGTFSRIPGMDNLSKNEEVERESTQTMLTEPSNPASIEIRLCAGRISLLQAKLHDLQEENRLLRARSRH